MIRKRSLQWQVGEAIAPLEGAPSWAADEFASCHYQISSDLESDGHPKGPLEPSEAYSARGPRARQSVGRPARPANPDVFVSSKLTRPWSEPLGLDKVIRLL